MGSVSSAASAEAAASAAAADAGVGVGSLLLLLPPRPRTLSNLHESQIVYSLYSQSWAIHPARWCSTTKHAKLSELTAAPLPGMPCVNGMQSVLLAVMVSPQVTMAYMLAQ